MNVVDHARLEWNATPWVRTRAETANTAEKTLVVTPTESDDQRSEDQNANEFSNLANGDGVGRNKLVHFCAHLRNAVIVQ